MQVLGEHSELSERGTSANTGRRRGARARVRARRFSTGPKRARRAGRNHEAHTLPEPLLTVQMALADLPPADLPLADFSPTDFLPTDFLPADLLPADLSPADFSPAPEADLSVDHPVVAPAELGDSRPTSDDGDLEDTVEWEERHAAGIQPYQQPKLLAPSGFPTFVTGGDQLPDPVQLATAPSRLPEALLAAVLSIVACLAAWGSAAPTDVWISLATLPAVGLIALALPGGHWARAARAGALLSSATTMAILAPAMTPVTLVIALAAAALYPMLVSTAAGRTVTALAIASLAAPLAIAALADGPIDFFRFLLAADGDPTTAVRLALGSGMLVVALVGGTTMATQRTLTHTASLAVIRERTARAATAQLGAAANCDPSTGLPNREALLRTLTIALSEGDRRRSGEVGLMVIDIEGFADLADGLGSAVAEAAVEQVATRLRTGFPEPAFLARVSRHQFALLLPEATYDGCGDLAREITRLMTAPVRLADHAHHLTCSIGAVLPGSGLRTADDLLQAGDEASRAAQRSGRSRWLMFDVTFRQQALRQAELEIELRDAVRDEKISVDFQPVLAFGTGEFEHGEGMDDRIVGTEVLARWTRDDGTTVGPGCFIPLADQLGLGVALGMQVIRQGLAALIAWRAKGLEIDQIWVNVTPSQLEDPEFAHEMAAQLAIRGLAPSSVVLEVSAGRFSESEQCVATLGLLRSLGIAVALDDFGRSGTSLSALRRLPISAVKLDPSLAPDLSRQNAVPKAMAQLSRALGLRVVVKGVETMAQLRGAREIQADAVQGIAIARPMSAEDVTDLLTLRLPRDVRLR